MEMQKRQQMPVFLLHGLGCTEKTLLPLMWWLKYAHGYQRVQTVAYPADTKPLVECIQHVHDVVAKQIEPGEPVAFVGQSFGGLVANHMHECQDLNIAMAVMVGAPLHGASLLNQLESVLPTTVRDWFNKPVPYDFLKRKARDQEPPHPYHTISMGWAWSDWDRCVYRHEATLNPKHHTHLAWMDHATGFANPRLWSTVGRLLQAASHTGTA